MTSTPPALRVAHTHPGADPELRDWRHVHNTIIPTAPLTLDDIRTLPGDTVPFRTLRLA